MKKEWLRLLMALVLLCSVATAADKAVEINVVPEAGEDSEVDPLAESIRF